MNKPVKRHRHTPSYDYHEVIDWVESKYNIDTRDYKREVDGKYKDFWHVILDSNEIHNGCYFHLPNIWIEEEDDDKYDPWWVREILELIYREFPDIEEVYVCW